MGQASPTAGGDGLLFPNVHRVLASPSGCWSAGDALRALTLLSKLHYAGLIESYVLFSLGDASIGHDYAAYQAKERKKLEEYMDRFVVPPAHQDPLR